jgi:hypothetical protein
MTTHTLHLHLPPRRPLLHAAVSHRVGRSYGVELDALKCQKAGPFVRHVVSLLGADPAAGPPGTALSPSALPTIFCLPVEKVRTARAVGHLHGKVLHGIAHFTVCIRKSPDAVAKNPY